MSALQEHPKFGVLERFIGIGTDLIRQRSFVAALRHFEDPSFAATLGWQLDSQPVIVYPHLHEDVIGLVANLSSFDHIFTSWGIPVIQIATLDPTDERVPKNILRNAALIHAEEWLHGLQFLNGQKPIAGFDDIESDVASYLLAKDVELTKEFLGEYNRRADLGIP